MKYSGNSSPHIIIPGEVLRPHVKRFSELSKLYKRVYDFARKRMKRSNLLDMSFLTAPRHYLRLAYSINEHTGSKPARSADGLRQLQAQYGTDSKCCCDGELVEYPRKCRRIWRGIDVVFAQTEVVQ